MFALFLKNHGEKSIVNLKYYQDMLYYNVIIWHKRKKEKDFTLEPG
jgi:hypothetical protein